MNNVVSLDLVRQAKLSPHAAFEASRQQMLRHFLSWVETRPEPNDVRDEMESLEGAMRGIAQLYGASNGR